jgi:hypothetical protein
VIDYIANDPFPAETHEEGLDRNTMIAQQVSEATERSIKLSRTNTMTSTEFTVGATDRANKVLSFDSSGELSVTQELGTFRGDWSASTAYQVRDLVKDTSTNNIFLVNTAHTSSGSQPLTTNTNSAKYDLIVDAASATTSATAAAASATTATTKASEAATSATNAANSATSAASSRQLRQKHQRLQHQLPMLHLVQQLLPQKHLKHLLQRPMQQQVLLLLTLLKLLHKQLKPLPKPQLIILMILI